MQNTTQKKSGKSPRYHSIHLCLKLDSGFGRGILDGLSAYGGHRTDWRFGIVSGHHSATGPPHADAFLGSVKPGHVERWDAKQRGMVVNTSRSHDFPGIVSVTCDDRRIGRLAADHLLGKGLTSFAYYGPAPNRREEAFHERIQEAKGHSYTPFFEGAASRGEEDINHWLADLPKCTGIMTFNDGYALQLLWVADSMGRGVPEDLAVIGVDADPVQSLLSPVPITSVDPDFYTVGYRAAEFLDRILQGYDACDERIRIPPAGIVEQATTDFPGVDDPWVIEAARYIRRHACAGIRAADVVATIPLSRRPLEHRFRKYFGRTILEEIHRVRIDEAARLLTHTGLTISTVAKKSGYSSRTKLTQIFGKTTDMSPSEYRRRHRAGRQRTEGKGEQNMER